MPTLLIFYYYSFSDLWVEDEAVYICEAQNHFGKIEAKARITVTGLGRCKRLSSILWRQTPIAPFVLHLKEKPVHSHQCF